MFHAKTKLSRANINYFLKAIANSMSSSNFAGKQKLSTQLRIIRMEIMLYYLWIPQQM